MMGILAVERMIGMFRSACLNTAILALVFLCANCASAQGIKIGLFQRSDITAANLVVAHGSYEVQTEGKILFETNAGGHVNFKVSAGKINVIHSGKSIGHFRQVSLVRTNWSAEFKLKPTVPNKKQRIYQDNLLIKVRKGKLVFINEVVMESYVAGVVESESGAGHLPEYYKAQSIISRTYALANKTRHQTTGFHLCDQVHCQVYHGKARYDHKIQEAARETRKHVLVDHEIRLITAAFHSNCGGHTINAENVWSRHLPYLIGRPDTFCLVMSQSHWEKDIDKSKWLNYLGNKGFVLDSLGLSAALSYFPPTKQEYFGSDIHVAQIRSDMGLRSAWFTIHENRDQVTFIGRGFGHGVGLCQEGAIRMAQLGYNYSEILHYYYTDVHIIDLNYLDFFKD